ncbi:TlyA family RNA methyltransferase [Prosthecomicrobium pneumaticum]|uniref:23S rRNA (Cytidine1920-2'-O)/16S rRNA (Cytidine1409-2'-O)-methyltransferase n=1 Tax=Prosthecomicrobium pneumaticum TaxID=81895 RepID=A0A7W9CV24_9HYPH|nr:TlyA family RNA methyltransferase [Prosthecomicrobium pneumaticum]MBB5752088.1 23S rRNA (cytidine1920-2'-O)/16S rRNA (cytidine1409-2'-O)-methyltransferase [Prosthecomicrobium pneumaticum]
MTDPSLRLDQALVARGLVPTRARARDAILRGHVRVAGRLADKPGTSVPHDAELAIDDPASAYVSRAALKLVAGLDAFGYDPAGRVALDLGASTGGFTQVLLERGAARVHAFDVGHGQLHPALAADPRVVSREGFNVRDLTAAEIGEPVGAVVSDLSFISLRLGLPPALTLAAPGAFLVALIKPQFEVGRAHVGKGGLVRDGAAIDAAVEGIRAFVAATPGWIVEGVAPSPITGGDGNREFLIGARKKGGGGAGA